MAISSFISRCMNEDPPVIHGDGTQTRDFTFIEDVVEANVTLLTVDAAEGEAVNIEINTPAEEIRDQLTPELDLVYEERYDADAQHTNADTTKLSDLLGYEPSHTIREGVAEFVDWCRVNRDWYELLVRRS
jgi:UDP-glucose 4-epimerase